MRTKISKISLFFFVLNYNYIFLRVIVFPYLYDDFGVSGYIWIGVICLVLSIALFIVPKKMYQFDFFSRYKTSKIKYVANVLLGLRVALGIMVTGLVISEMFYKEINPLIFIFPLLLIVIIISSGRPTNIIEISTMFSIVGLLLYCFYYFSTIPFDFSLLMISSIRLPDFLFSFIILALFFDNMVVLLTNKEKMQFSKGIFICGIISSFLIFLGEYLSLLLSSGEGVFSNNRWIGFIALSIQKVSPYIGNLDFVYIVILLIACAFKFAFFLSTIRNSIGKQINRTKTILLLFLILGVITFITYKIFLINRSLMLDIVIGIISLLIFTFIWMVKEAYHAKSIKE